MKRWGTRMKWLLWEGTLLNGQRSVHYGGESVCSLGNCLSFPYICNTLAGNLLLYSGTDPLMDLQWAPPPGTTKVALNGHPMPVLLLWFPLAGLLSHLSHPGNVIHRFGSLSSSTWSLAFSALLCAACHHLAAICHYDTMI